MLLALIALMYSNSLEYKSHQRCNIAHRPKCISEHMHLKLSHAGGHSDHMLRQAGMCQHCMTSHCQITYLNGTVLTSKDVYCLLRACITQHNAVIIRVVLHHPFAPSLLARYPGGPSAGSLLQSCSHHVSLKGCQQPCLSAQACKNSFQTTDPEDRAWLYCRCSSLLGCRVIP